MKPPQGPNRFGAAVLPADFIAAIKKFFAGYFDFKGRASRTEYWYSMLFYVAMLFVLARLNLPDTVISVILLVTAVSLFSVTTRRLHDTNRSGWYQIVSWIIPIGTIWAVFWLKEPARD